MSGRKKLAAGLLFFFLGGFTLDAEGRDGASFEPLVGNFSLTGLADPVGRGVHPIQRLIDLLEQLPLAITDAHRKILIHLGRRLITDIGKRFLTGPVREHFSRFIKDGRALALEIAADVGVFRRSGTGFILLAAGARCG